MPLAIRAIQTYGRSQAFEHNYLLAQLAQTETTVEWAIEELHRQEDQAEDNDPDFPALSELLCSAEPHLLFPRADRILQAPGFSEELASALRERVQLASWDAEQCWKELKRIATEAVREDDPLDVDFGHVGRVVAALAPQGEPYVERMLELLGRKPENYDTDPLSWLEIFLVMLAGEMRLERALPRIVKKMHEGGEGLREECVVALGKIGTDDAAEAVAEGWSETEWEYRLYASEALEKIHSDTTVRKCLELLPQEKKTDIKTCLADALLGQFTDEAIEPVRALVERRAYDSMMSDLMGKLVAVSTVVGVTFPEHAIWKRESEERLAGQERRMKKALEDFRASAQPPVPSQPAPAREREAFLEQTPVPFLRTEKQVGRNDPCPCGSGKKFKKCCLNRSKG